MFPVGQYYQWQGVRGFLSYSIYEHFGKRLKSLLAEGEKRIRSETYSILQNCIGKDSGWEMRRAGQTG